MLSAKQADSAMLQTTFLSFFFSSPLSFSCRDKFPDNDANTCFTLRCSCSWGLGHGCQTRRQVRRAIQHRSSMRPIWQRTDRSQFGPQCWIRLLLLRIWSLCQAMEHRLRTCNVQLSRRRRRHDAIVDDVLARASPCHHRTYPFIWYHRCPFLHLLVVRHVGVLCWWQW